MLSFPKLVVLVLLVVVVWYALRWLQGPPRAMPTGRGRARRAAPPPALEAEDLVRCPICRAYSAIGAPGCGRPDCPRPR